MCKLYMCVYVPILETGLKQEFIFDFFSLLMNGSKY